MPSLHAPPLRRALRRLARAPRLLPLLVALGAALGACSGDVATADACSVTSDCPDDAICALDGDALACVAPAAGLAEVPDRVPVPAGPFQMGCNAATDTLCEPNEAPQHQVSVPAFEIDRTEVTQVAFAAFLTANGETQCGGEWCLNLADPALPMSKGEGAVWSPGPGADRHPATHVTWFGADAYCAWADAALCTEAQWEKAARGGCELAGADCAAGAAIHPWGDAEATCDLAVWWESGTSWGCGTDSLWAVGSKPAGAGPYGALDMAGNAWEWVADTFHTSFDGAPADGSAWVDEGQNLRILKGGGAKSERKWLRASFRGDGGARDGDAVRGFRCCRPN